MKDANEHEIRAWLAEQESAMLALLAELVNIDSGSYDKPGVDAVSARLAQFFESAGIASGDGEWAVVAGGADVGVGEGGVGRCSCDFFDDDRRGIGKDST